MKWIDSLKHWGAPWIQGACIIGVLSGFAVFATNGTFFKWNIRNGDTVPFILNPVGCECNLTDEEVLAIFRSALQTWNDVEGSYFQFVELQADYFPRFGMQYKQKHNRDFPDTG